ncbi:hypothetical protein B0T25DRAFT_59954 [Lasiosphaeria hispida]|uniref:Uncharacterized protein n=1 Tax=Lasiosphaeria hispida TaxID=260671 RepID=A0AAJ0HWP4_9PEZI|nr:hypothetical protein B0T25DRAFT_59954 [Lasiosphaeria hispida]
MLSVSLYPRDNLPPKLILGANNVLGELGSSFVYRSSCKGCAISNAHANKSFLEGKNELGLALRPLDWKESKPCFLCFGMMGYQTVIDWPLEKQDEYMSTFV